MQTPAMIKAKQEAENAGFKVLWINKNRLRAVIQTKYLNIFRKGEIYIEDWFGENSRNLQHIMYYSRDEWYRKILMSDKCKPFHHYNDVWGGFDNYEEFKQWAIGLEKMSLHQIELNKDLKQRCSGFKIKYTGNHGYCLERNGAQLIKDLDCNFCPYETEKTCLINLNKNSWSYDIADPNANLAIKIDSSMGGVIMKFDKTIYLYYEEDDGETLLRTQYNLINRETKEEYKKGAPAPFFAPNYFYNEVIKRLKERVGGGDADRRL